MNNNQNQESSNLNHFIKYKWLYLWAVAVAALVFGLLMLFIKEFGQSVIYIITGFGILTFVIIRLIPLIKTTRDKWAIVINTAELLIDLGVAVLTLLFVFRKETASLEAFYPFLLGGVLYLRGFVYMTEVVFFKTKVETVKFFVHLLLLTVGTAIIARFDNYTVEALRWLFGLAFTVGGVVAVIDGSNSFGRYRKLYIDNSKKKEDTQEKGESVELPAYQENDIKEPEIPVVPINDNNDDDRPNIVA